ncbi:MAG: hypothetical protein WC969_15580 [Elusimicrobiota bacterium]|jgi:hypothetical protein
MALFGTFWQNLGPISVAPVTGGAALLGYAGYQHSLGTTAEVVLPVLRSAAAIVNGTPALLALPGNVSQATLGWALPSVASMVTLAFDAYAAVIHSSVR